MGGGNLKRCQSPDFSSSSQSGIFFVAQKLHLETGSSFDYQGGGGGGGGGEEI